MNSLSLRNPLAKTYKVSIYNNVNSGYVQVNHDSVTASKHQQYTTPLKSKQLSRIQPLLIA